MMIMIYFHWIIQSPMHPERQIPVFVKALSLDNLILLLLATPVQVCLFNETFKINQNCLAFWGPIILYSKLEGY